MHLASCLLPIFAADLPSATSNPVSFGLIPIGGSDAVDHIKQAIIVNVAFLAAVGALSAALVKVVCDLSAVRSWVNKNFLYAWITERLSHKLTLTAHSGVESKIYGLRRPTLSPRADAMHAGSTGKAWEEIVELSVAGHETALIELESAKLCGQVSAGARLALQFPIRYPDFFAVLTSSIAHDPELAVYLNGMGGETEGSPAGAAYTDARSSVSNAALRTIDALQILLDARWAWWRQIAGFMFSIVIAFLALLHLRAGYADGWTFGVRVIISSVAGAFLAPVALAVAEALGGLGPRS